jgi:RNA polymerase sigma-70 factor (ECF subfamily)
MSDGLVSPTALAEVPMTTIGEALAKGSHRYPGVVLPVGLFAEHIAAIGATGSDVEDRAEDIFLACACAATHPQAMVHFERQYLTNIQSLVPRVDLSADQWKELRQRIRLRLFVGTNPRILQYAGHGALGAWLRLVAIRIAFDLLKEQGPDLDGDDFLDNVVATFECPELAAARKQDLSIFRCAVEKSILNLGPREKTLLRLHFLDGLSMDAIGAIYKVHRSTVMRWLMSIRRNVLGSVGRRLAKKLGDDTAVLQSFMRVFYDDLFDLSVTRLFRNSLP